MAQEESAERKVRVAFPAVNRNGTDMIVHVDCLAHLKTPGNPQATDNRFTEVIKRYRGVEGAANPPYTFFDTNPRMGNGLELTGDSFQLAVVLADRMARHGYTEHRQIIATGCMPQNDGAVGPVNVGDFEKKVDLLLKEAPVGSIFIFPQSNSVAEACGKLEQLKTTRSVELKPINQLDELKNVVWKADRSAERTVPLFASYFRYGSFKGIAVKASLSLVLLFFAVPIAYWFAFQANDPSQIEDQSDWANSLKLNTVAAYNAYRQKHPQGRHADEAAQAIAAVQSDDADWAVAQALNTAAAYDTYGRKHPKGRHFSDAVQTAASIRRDDRDWTAAQKANTAVAYENYERDHPQGGRAVQARQIAASIRQDDNDWVAATKANTAAAFEIYLHNHPQGLHVEEAKGDLISTEKDDSDWTAAQKLNTVSGYERYQQDHSQGLHVEDARRIIASIVKDGGDWLAAQQLNTAQSYQNYLRDHPQGYHVEDATQRLAAIRAAKALEQADKSCADDSDVRRQGIADISNSILRDGEYLKLLDDLLVCKSLVHAIYVASQISNSIWKDQAFAKIAKAAISNKNYDLAKEAINRVSNSIARDGLWQAYIAATTSRSDYNGQYIAAPTEQDHNEVDTGSHKEPGFIDYSSGMKFFSSDGKPLVWYFKDPQGAFELYDAPGYHPRSGEKLLPITKDIIKELQRIARECVTYYNYDGNGAFSGISLDCATIAGTWNGQILYENGKLPPKPFTFTFDADACRGRGVEPGINGQPAYSNLRCANTPISAGKTITIIKSYDGSGGARIHSVTYTGIISSDLRKISGKWITESGLTEGEFLMSRDAESRD